MVELIPDNYRLVHNPAPATPEEAKFSIQFCLALAAVTGGCLGRDGILVNNLLANYAHLRSAGSCD